MVLPEQRAVGCRDRVDLIARSHDVEDSVAAERWRAAERLACRCNDAVPACCAGRGVERVDVPAGYGGVDRLPISGDGDPVEVVRGVQVIALPLDAAVGMKGDGDSGVDIDRAVGVNRWCWPAVASADPSVTPALAAVRVERDHAQAVVVEVDAPIRRDRR